MKKRGLSLLLVLMLLLVSCDQSRYFEKNIDLKENSWSYENEISFEIKNTNLTDKKLFVNLRHSALFSYRNILLKAYVQNPNGEKETIHINIPLSEPNGKWYGDCSGDICTIQSPLSYNMTDTGNYTFKIAQDMRVNPLEDVFSVGLRVENITSE